MLSMGIAAAHACRGTGEAGRTIIALYDGTRTASPRVSRIHRFAEMPLNHLGYRLVYHDISAGLPPVPEVPVAATLSWFDAAVPDPEALASWRVALRDLCGEGPAMIVLGDPGLSDAALGSDAGAGYLALMGMSLAGGQVSLGAFSTIEHLDKDRIGHETAFNIQPGIRNQLVALRETDSHLRIGAGGTEVDLLVLAPDALYADDSVLVRDDPRGGALWTTDPFALFTHALSREVWPVPDVTTLSGQRMYFATVKSEGWLTRLPARQFGDVPPLASEVLDRDLITPYPDLPVTIAPLMGDLDPDVAGAAAGRGRDVATHLLGLPQVQSGTVGASLILNWPFFAAYDRQSEQDVLADGTAQDRRGALVATAVQSLGNTFSDTSASALDVTPFAPRKYIGLPFDLTAETAGAISAVAGLSPASAPAPIFIWSGNAEPFPEALQSVASTGAPNMGGGGGRMTLAQPSLGDLWPIGIRSEGGFQVYDALSGDVSYTDFWTSDLSAFHALQQTLIQTEMPRRLKPFHLSFSARSAIDFATRSAVQRHLDLARTSEVTPVSAARYSRIAASFDSVTVTRDGPSGWRITNRGALQTMRIDNGATVSLDFDASEGVLGARRKGLSLYVALAPDADAPLISLVENDRPDGIVSSGTVPALIRSDAEILSASRESCTTRMTMLGYGAVEAEWRGAANTTYEIVLFEQDGTTRRQWEQVSTDATGRFGVRLPLPTAIPAEVSITAPCGEG